MHSRALLLLRRDLINLERLPIEGIVASPLFGEDLYHWNAKIHGLKGTVWEGLDRHFINLGGVFQINLMFTDEYNTCPPSVKFMTIPYHPNIHPSTGVPSLSLLKEGWNESSSLSSLLLSLQVILNNPELEPTCIVNHEAAHYYVNAPHTYKQMALDCVAASLRIDAGLTPYDSHKSLCPSQLSLPINNSPQQTQKQFKNIPFDDYHTLWQGLATSVPAYNPSNKFIQLLDKDDFLRKVHFETEDQKSKDLERRTEGHLALKYGLSRKKKKPTLTNIQDKKKRITDLTSLYTSHNTDDCDAVDELLAWTTTLDEKKLYS